MFVAPMNVVRRDVVPTSTDPGLHTLDVQFRTGQPHVPDVHLDALFSGLNKKACDGVPAEGGLEGKLKAFIDRPTQQARTLAPGCAVGVRLCQSRGFLSEGAGHFVRIEILASVLTDGRAADAALPAPLTPANT